MTFSTCSPLTSFPPRLCHNTFASTRAAAGNSRILFFNLCCCGQKQNTLLQHALFLQPVLLLAKAKYFASTRAAAGNSRILSFNLCCCGQKQNTLLQPVRLLATAEYFASTCVAAGQSKIFCFNTRCCWQQQNTFLQPVLLRAKAEYFASTRAVSSTCVAAGQSRILLLQHALLLAIVKTGARCIMSEAGSAISSPSTGRSWRRLEASLGWGLGSLIGGVFSLPWLNTGCLLLFVKQGTSL